MNPLKDFYESERKRVFEPDSFFTQRVMARLNERVNVREIGLWDAIPGSTRPVLALALMLILCFVAAELFVPQEPETGVVEAFLAPDQNPAESFLYNDTDTLSRQDVLQRLLEAEEQ